ncbi:MAG: NhaP-type Na+/H+ or K+/H+ antiporter, partial [Oleiphilaceae bacterium]
MTMYQDLVLLSVCILLFACIAGRVEKSWVTGPIVFIFVGFLIGPLGLDWLSFKPEAPTIKLLAELTLALVLFNDAAGANLKVLRKASSIPVRMLLIGLPLVLLFGFGAGVLLFDNLSLIEIGILATLLAPTDAALGQAVLKNKAVPQELRQGLNAESGLNDGLCVPILFVFLALAATASGSGHETHDYLALTLLAEELGVGLFVGLAMVAVSVHLIRYAFRQGWITPGWSQMIVIALAISSFAMAQAVGGSGFIAAFCGGLLFGYLQKDHREELLHSSESVGDTFALITWVLFGAAVVGSSIPSLTWPIVMYSALSLTVIRMLPIFISLLGTGVSTEGKLFLGWFGPRGLASIVFGVIVINANLPNNDTIVTTVV